MLNHLKSLTGLVLVSLFTIGDLPSVFSQKVAQAQTTTSVPANRPAANSIARSQRSGRITVEYGETDDPISAELMQGYQQYGLFEKVGNLITSEINLPRDITLHLTNCDQANAFYRKEDHAIVICNQLTKSNYETFLANGDSKEEALKAAIFTSVFTFFHESGHMLIHELDLTVVGKEEDIADQFSAFFLLANDSSEGQSVSGEIVTAAAKLFALTSTDPNNGQLQDEHALNQQRFYNLVCMLYGANPEKYQDLVTQLKYAESRLGSCQVESESIMANWKRLLEPYLKA